MGFSLGCDRDLYWSRYERIFPLVSFAQKNDIHVTKFVRNFKLRIPLEAQSLPTQPTFDHIRFLFQSEYLAG